MTRDSTTGTDIHFREPKPSLLVFIPGFVLVLALYVIGTFFIVDPRAVLFGWGQYGFSWIETLFLIATIVSLFEQMKVSHPGIDNTLEALLMGGVAVVQIVLFVLGAAGIGLFLIFANSEFLMLTFISVIQSIIAILINARTLRRTIGVGDNG